MLTCDTMNIPPCCRTHSYDQQLTTLDNVVNWMTTQLDSCHAIHRHKMWQFVAFACTRITSGASMKERMSRLCHNTNCVEFWMKRFMQLSLFYNNQNRFQPAILAQLPQLKHDEICNWLRSLLMAADCLTLYLINIDAADIGLFHFVPNSKP
jgi:hypothetical protein